MFKILILEDDYEQLNFLHNTIKNEYPNWEVFSASNYDEAKATIDNSINNKELFSLFLFDIQLSPNTSDRGGFLISEHLRKYSDYYMTPILFLTSISDQTAFALSNYHCYNYITKPYTAKDILTQIQQLLLTGYIKHTHFRIRDINNIIYNIPFSDIYYIQSHLHSLSLHTSDSNIAFRGYTFSSLPSLLTPAFIQCHKSYMINIKRITSIDILNQKILIGNTWIPIGRKYLENIKTLKGVY